MERLPLNQIEIPQPLRVDPNKLEYLAGLFDVSGSITIERNRDYRVKDALKYGYTLRAEIERVLPETADSYREILPGYDGSRNLPSGKTTSRWYIKGLKARLFLETLGPHFRLKARHWQTIQDYIATSKARPTEDSERLKTEITKLNDNPEISFALPITDSYLAGVFDGHGSIDVHNQDNHLNLITIVHTKHKLFMVAIGNYIGSPTFPNRSHGNIKTYTVVTHSTEAANLLERIQPYSIKYRKLIPLALKFQRQWEHDKGKKRVNEQKESMESVRRLIMLEKAHIRTGLP